MNFTYFVESQVAFDFPSSVLSPCVSRQLYEHLDDLAVLTLQNYIVNKFKKTNYAVNNLKMLISYCVRRCLNLFPLILFPL